jgi:hypothetical protein
MGATVDIQYFASSGTWVKPHGAVRVDALMQAAGAGGTLDKEGGDGELAVRSIPASELPDEVAVEIGRGGRGGSGGGPGRDGYALILTHLATGE